MLMVIYLQETGSDLVRENAFTLEKTRHEFEIVRLWEEPTDRLLSSPGLLPLAVLSQSSDRSSVLQRVAQSIEQISDPRVQSNVAASTYILAGLVLEQEVIDRLLGRDIMQESVTYQSIKAEARAEGRAEERLEVAVNLLKEGMSIETIARVTGLSTEQVRHLQTVINANASS